MAQRIAREEWPRIRNDIDSGLPSPLGLATVGSPNPLDLDKNDQVVAYAYDVDENNGRAISVYCPNWPDRDGVCLLLNIDQPSQPIAIQHSGNMPVRGFFGNDYTVSDVRAALGAA